MRPAVPSAKEAHAMGVIGLDLRKAGRLRLMNQVGAVLGIPPGGWHGQAQLFDGDDSRLRALLVRLARPVSAGAASSSSPAGTPMAISTDGTLRAPWAAPGACYVPCRPGPNQWVAVQIPSNCFASCPIYDQSTTNVRG